MIFLIISSSKKMSRFAATFCRSLQFSCLHFTEVPFGKAVSMISSYDVQPLSVWAVKTGCII